MRRTHLPHAYPHEPRLHQHAPLPPRDEEPPARRRRTWTYGAKGVALVRVIGQHDALCAQLLDPLHKEFVQDRHPKGYPSIPHGMKWYLIRHFPFLRLRYYATSSFAKVSDVKA